MLLRLERSKKPFIVMAILAVLFVIALPLDVPAAALAHNSGAAKWLSDQRFVSHLLRVPAHFVFFTIPVCAMLLAVALRQKRRGWQAYRDVAIVLLAGIFSAINGPLKWIIGRVRPYHGVPAFDFHPFRAGLMSVEASLSFPSGDVTLAAAMATSLTMVLPRFWPLWWTLMIVTSLERIAANAHYPSDTVAGAALGIFVAVIAREIVSRFAGKNPPIDWEVTAAQHEPAETPSIP
jgi:membrane-associated phospholipid phosphatase